MFVQGVVVPEKYRSWSFLVRLVQRRDHYKCQMCGIPSSETHVTAHHIIPRAHGGPTIPSNLILLCDPCHDLAEQERMPSAEVIRGWFPEWGRLERLAAIYHEEKEMPKREQSQPVDTTPLDERTTHGECYFCGSKEYTYVWRIAWAQERIMCLGCYQTRLVHGEGWALKYGQAITDVASKKYDRSERNYPKTFVAVSEAENNNPPLPDTSLSTDTPRMPAESLVDDSTPVFGMFIASTV